MNMEMMVLQIAYPEPDGNAAVVAGAVFGVVVLIGIAQLLTRKWQGRGEDDKG